MKEQNVKSTAAYAEKTEFSKKVSPFSANLAVHSPSKLFKFGGQPSAVGGLAFSLPPELEASAPAEARGLARDEVRLMVSYLADNRVTHTQFRALPDFLNAGDLLVINTSGTLNAALSATRADGTPLQLHLSTHLPADLWSVEVRQPDGITSRPFHQAVAGETLTLPAEATATLHTPYRPEHRRGGPTRLWIATLHLPESLSSGTYAPSSTKSYVNTAANQRMANDNSDSPFAHSPFFSKGSPGSNLETYLGEYGFPIRYYYIEQPWPGDYYQTVYATEPGSAEMPSAGRAFTPELMTRLVAKGVQIAPLILHTGVASLEDHEPPYEEFYRVPLDTARQVNMARAAGKRVIAVGTTVVRALETVTDAEGTTHPGEGWTRLVITPEQGLRAVNGLLTGLHEPEASHLAMLQALAGLEHLEITYGEALEQGYLWHEFGDLHLMLP
ncbi:MAG: S-adenosylmethionine:tRNA ribosyltransferase-isomerase [Chloroflexota bacterium]|nr:MAG: S-adenosylmethionine:tRNA ribosyltransferase-isomerase [Chloroflexota bacterium]